MSNLTRYANLHLYSDVVPYEIVRVVSDKTIEIRRMNAERLDFKPEFVPGGFSAHCVNNQQQNYEYRSDVESPVIRARRHKNGDWVSVYGRHQLSDRPFRFYDYNF